MIMVSPLEERMGYQIVKLQNASNFPGNQEPTVSVSLGEEGWKEAYNNWLKGKNPTESKEWKKGVVACTRSSVE